MNLEERNNLIALANDAGEYENLLGMNYSEGGEAESPDEEMEDDQGSEIKGYADGGLVNPYAADDPNAPLSQNVQQTASGPKFFTDVLATQPLPGAPLGQGTVPQGTTAPQPGPYDNLFLPKVSPTAGAQTAQQGAPSRPLAAAAPTGAPTAAQALQGMKFAEPSFAVPAAAPITTPTFAKPVLKAEKDLPAQVVNLAPMQVLESYGGTPVSFARPTSAMARLEDTGIGGVTFAGTGTSSGQPAQTPRTPAGYAYTSYQSLSPEALVGAGNKTQILDMFKGVTTQQQADVDALRKEYNLAMSYGNTDLAGKLKDILTAQEQDVERVKQDQLNAAKYFTGAGGAYETPELLRSRVQQEQLAAKKLEGFSGLDLGAIGFTPETKADPLTAAVAQQQNEYGAALNTYNKLAATYGKDTDIAKNYLSDFVTPQKTEYEQALAAQQKAGSLYGTITGAAKYPPFAAPKLAEIRNITQTEASFKPILGAFDTNIKTLTAARDNADKLGLSGYANRLNQLIDTENSKLDQARGALESAKSQAEPDPMRDFILGKQMAAQKIDKFADMALPDIDYSRSNVNQAFDPFIARQNADYQAALGTYNQLKGLYGDKADVTRNFLNDVVNPQRDEVTKAQQLKGFATTASNAINANYGQYATPRITISNRTTEPAVRGAFGNILKAANTNIANLEKAKTVAEQTGVGYYTDRINQLIDAERSKIDRANQDIDNYLNQIPGRATGSPITGEVADSKSRAMLKKLQGAEPAPVKRAKGSPATGEVSSLERTETPVLGSVGRGIQRTGEFVSAPFGYENPPGRALMELLGIQGTGRALEDVAQGLPLTRGKGQATYPTENAKALLESVANVAPVVGPAAKMVGKGAKKAAKELGPTLAEKAMKYAPAAEPMYAVKPKGGTFYPPESGSQLDAYLDRVVKDLSSAENLAGKDAARVAEFIRQKGRKYLTTEFGTGDDSLRAALLEGRLPRYGDDKKRFRSYALEAARGRGTGRGAAAAEGEDAAPEMARTMGDIEARADLEQAYDAGTSIAAKRIRSETEAGSGYPGSNKAQEIVKQKMREEGVLEDLINPTYPSATTLEDLRRSYSSDADKSLADLLEGKLPEESAKGMKSLAYAAKTNEPIYDISNPQLDFMRPTNVAQGIASIPVKDLERMTFPEALIKGAQNMRLTRDWQSVLDNAKNGKTVPKEIYFKGTNPVYSIDDNKQWVRVASPDAVELEGAAMRHSIGGYKTSNKYNLGGKEAFDSGLARVFSLRDKKGIPQVTVESKFTDQNGLEITEVRSKFNSEPTEQDKKAVFELFDTLGPTSVKSTKYTVDRSGDKLPVEKEFDWGNAYQDYRLYKNKGEE